MDVSFFLLFCFSVCFVLFYQTMDRIFDKLIVQNHGYFDILPQQFYNERYRLFNLTVLRPHSIRRLKILFHLYSKHIFDMISFCN